MWYVVSFLAGSMVTLTLQWLNYRGFIFERASKKHRRKLFSQIYGREPNKYDL